MKWVSWNAAAIYNIVFMGNEGLSYDGSPGAN
jgi:hypothetical protein